MQAGPRVMHGLGGQKTTPVFMDTGTTAQEDKGT